MSGVLLLDQSAAFDLLDHSILEKKLQCYNFEEGTKSWILSFLSDRTQEIQVDNWKSDERRLGKHSIPQGSVLGGLCHNISTNDLPWTPTPNSKRTIYLDDATSSTSSKNVA